MDFGYNVNDLSISIPILTGLLSFLIYWFSYNSKNLQIFIIKKYGPGSGHVNFILFTRYLGGFSMGILPSVSYYLLVPATRLNEMGLIFKMDMAFPFFFSAFFIVLLILPIVYFNAKNHENLLVYPQIRKSLWNQKLVLINFFSWAVYLLGYEILFRGILLFPLSQTMGMWPAITVNIALYSCTHISKGYKETLGAIPFSIVLCLLCLYTGSFWIAFIAHLTMAWTNTWFSLKHSPVMNIIKI